MKITQTNGNNRNGIKGSRITVRTNEGMIVDQFVVPSRDAKSYCERHPGGRYGRRLAIATAAAMEIVAAIG